MDRKILDYLPPAVRELREIQAAAAGQEHALTDLWDAARDALDNQYIGSLKEYGIQRWETLLKLSPKGADTLDERRFRILTRLGEKLPFTFRILCRQLEDLCGEDGYSAAVDPAEYRLTVRVALTASRNFDDVGELLRRVTPANLIVDLSLMYNQCKTLAAKTHEDFRHTPMHN